MALRGKDVFEAAFPSGEKREEVWEKKKVRGATKRRPHKGGQTHGTWNTHEVASVRHIDRI